MPAYTDGFVIPVPKKNLPQYRRMAAKAAKIWREHGALDYKECVGDDLAIQGVMSFPKGIGAKPSEVIVFSWITYKSRAQRDKVNKLIMADPRITKMCDPKKMPFDCARMLYGGFKVIVSA